VLSLDNYIQNYTSYHLVYHNQLSAAIYSTDMGELIMEAYICTILQWKKLRQGELLVFLSNYLK